ncbi:MAG: ATP-binding protein [Clostridia bacterium]|nr:ATP-binding protein [Clostridia bacterium]
MFKRKIYDKLLKWKNETQGSKAILVEGARRVGKSTVVEEFAKNNYKSYILIDFSKTTNSVKEAFDTLLNSLDSLFMVLSLEFDTPLYPRESLIIFDEVQKFPRAREAVKHLVKDGRYDFIETGSLISIKENVKDILIPSEEQSITMYPMDFEEFAWALGEEMLIEYIKDCFEKRVPLYDSIHKKAMFLFKQYMLVGGMPKAVDEFLLNSKQFAQCEREKRDILKTYRDDIHKIDRAYQSKVLSVFDQIPSFLSQHEKRVRINSISTDSTSIDYEETFFWLSDSMICNECFLCTDPNLGLSLNEKRNFVKCYMGDTGLLLTHTFDENNEKQTNYHKELLSDKLSINQGMFFENVVAQMLASNGYKLYFYTRYNEEKHRNDIEIDFLLTTGNKVSQKLIPLEVKSSKSYKAESMKKFIEKFSNRIDKAYIIHPKNLSIREDGIICIPAYMTFCL